MSKTLRTAALQIASELPKGDPTRRKLLTALLQGKTAGQDDWWVKGEVEEYMEDVQRTLSKLSDFKLSWTITDTSARNEPSSGRAYIQDPQDDYSTEVIPGSEGHAWLKVTLLGNGLSIPFQKFRLVLHADFVGPFSEFDGASVGADLVQCDAIDLMEGYEVSGDSKPKDVGEAIATLANEAFRFRMEAEKAGWKPIAASLSKSLLNVINRLYKEDKLYSYEVGGLRALVSSKDTSWAKKVGRAWAVAHHQGGRLSRVALFSSPGRGEPWGVTFRSVTSGTDESIEAQLRDLRKPSGNTRVVY